MFYQLPVIHKTVQFFQTTAELKIQIAQKGTTVEKYNSKYCFWPGEVFDFKVTSAQLQQSCPFLMRALRGRDAFNLEWCMIFRRKNANEVLVRLGMF